MTLAQAFTNRIPYSEALMRQLEDAIRLSVGYSKGHMKLVRRPKDYGDKYYCGLQDMGDNLRYRQFIQADNRSTEWTVAKAFKKGAALASTWVGTRIRFEKGGEEDYLVSCSVLILALREEFYPLIRAEWDHRGISDGRHAQPHWHMLTALQANTKDQLRGMEPKDFVAESTQTDLEHIESLHLAMGTNWTLSNGNQHTCELPTDKSLVNWVRKVSEYSIDQVQYALNKNGVQHSAFEVKDFAAS